MPEPRSYTYTTADGVTRRFRELFWPDMAKVAKLIPIIDQDEPWLNFYDLPANAPPAVAQQPDADNDLVSKTPLLDLCEIVFSKDYCDQPLTRKQLSAGRHISAQDLRFILQLARGVATLEDEKKAQPVAPPA